MYEINLTKINSFWFKSSNEGPIFINVAKVRCISKGLPIFKTQPQLSRQKKDLP
jgi:hypothetical protein